MTESLTARFARYRKSLVALAGAASTALSQGLLTGPAAKWSGIAIGALTAFGVYVAPNKR